ncbi:MAG: hypothetical protein U0168_16580 [Nannocystaceae bacterium]
MRRQRWIPLVVATALGCGGGGSSGSGGSSSSSDGSSGGADTTTTAAESSSSVTTGSSEAGSSSSTSMGMTTVADSGETTSGGLGTSPGCGTDPGSVMSGTIDVDGEQRSYLLVLPPDYDRDHAYPIVFGFHGQGGDSALAQSIYQLEDFWPEPVIVVYPQGLMQVGTETGWDLAENGVDIAFFDAMANAFAQQLCLDLDHIFAMGFSFGAYMSNYLACYRGSYIRGFAAVAGGGPNPGDTCQAPIGAMISHGTTDDVVPLTQGEASRNKWIAVNGCSDESSSWVPDDPDMLPTECLDYQGCERPTTWCTHIATHTWRSWMNVEIPRFLTSI